MCGFAGIASPRSQRAIPRHEVQAMLSVIAYRGPDDEAFAVLPHFAVGFRRLSIVDPEHGRQPMSTEDGALHLVVNGEIYNHAELRQVLEPRGHVFRTRSDSEVLLHAYREWGDACAGRLRGIFAFAIWDAPRRAIFLCRDRSGVKPLFLRVEGEDLRFASEAKAILAHPSTPRRLDLLGCFAPAAPDALLEASPFEGVLQLGAGCSLRFTGPGDLSPRRYWSYAPALEAGEDGAGEQEVVTFRDELSKVVAMQLMADVPLGAYLSGGLDSSVVAALAKTRRGELGTFTSVCAGSEDPWFSYALCASATGYEAHFVRFAPEELLEELPRVAWAAEGTFDLAFLARYQLAAAAGRRGIKVLLSGQGADELVGGYETSYFEYAASARRAAQAARLLECGSPAIARAILDTTHTEDHDVGAHLAREHAALTHYLLRFEDRMGMLAGVEVRVPYLDHRLVELCAGIGGSRRRRLFDDKHLLREVARGLLPDSLRLRKKFGFNAHLPPMTQLLASVEPRGAASNLLTDRTARDKGYFDARQVRRFAETRNYHALDAVLVVHMLDELFVTSFDPARFVGAPIAAPEIAVDASWMPVERVLLSARKGPSPADTPWLAPSVTYFGLLEAVEKSPAPSGHPRASRVLACQLNDGGRTMTDVPEGLDASRVVAVLSWADGERTYVELAATLGVSVESLLDAGRFLADEGLLEHGPRSLPS